MRDDTYDREFYGSSYRTNQSATVSATQTWERLTETRVMGAYATDRVVKSRSWAVGVSQWIWHESIRLAFDLSRTLIDQPLYQYLDFDSQEVGNPTIAGQVVPDRQNQRGRGSAKGCALTDFHSSKASPSAQP